MSTPDLPLANFITATVHALEVAAKELEALQRRVSVLEAQAGEAYNESDTLP